MICGLFESMKAFLIVYRHFQATRLVSLKGRISFVLLNMKVLCKISQYKNIQKGLLYFIAPEITCMLQKLRQVQKESDRCHVRRNIL